MTLKLRKLATFIESLDKLVYLSSVLYLRDTLISTLD